MSTLVTPKDLDDLSPSAPTAGLQPIADALCEWLPRIDCTTGARISAFMGQVAAEGGLRATTENLNYTPERICQVFGKGRGIELAEARGLAHKPERLAERVYGLGCKEKAQELGNSARGDGWRFRGRTVIQLTGKANYAHYGKLIGVDLVKDPDAANDPVNSVAIACLYWQEHDLNALADRGDVPAITRKINGGTNALAVRVRMTAKAHGIWSDARMANGPLAKDPNRPKSAVVLGVQQKLSDLGYATGNVDGKYGPILRAALTSFQTDNVLPVTGKIDDATLAAIDDADPRETSQARQSASLADAAVLHPTARVLHLGKRVMAWLGLGGTGVVGAANASDVAGGGDAAPDPLASAQAGLEKAQAVRQTAKGFWDLLGKDVQSFVCSHLVHFLFAVGGTAAVFGAGWWLFHLAGKSFMVQWHSERVR